MVRLRTDCIERPLRVGFEIMGHFIGTHPWWFLIIPLIFSVSLGSGFYFLQRRISNNIEEQFTPMNGPAKTERKYIEETFPGNDSMFSSLRQSRGGSYATVIAANNRNILTAESLQDILDLDFKIINMEMQLDNQSFKYTDVCAKMFGSCSSNDILDIIENNSSNIDHINFTFPWYHSDFKSIPLYLSLGSVKIKPESSVVESAEAVQLYYYLEDENTTKTDLWLQSFIDLVSNESSSSVQLSYSTSMSMQWEFEKTPSSVIYLFSITYTIAIIFSILTCWRSDNVRTKVWVAFGGVFSAGLAILSGFGVLLLLGQPFVMTAASCPFLILGIGLDDMFIMISCWQRTRVLDSVPDRLADTYRDAAISISITTLTDALALFLGYSSPFGSVQCFCLYAAVSVCFCYLYSITFLGACMALNGQREAGNRHWFTCMKLPEGAFNMCCVGAYLAVGIYGIFMLEEGLDLRNLALDDSYIVAYYDHHREHFSEYSYNVMVAIKQPLSYWEEDQQRSLQSCISNFKSLNFVNSTSAWFTSYEKYAHALNLDISSQEAFHTHLRHFLERSPAFGLDISLNADSDIRASRFFIQTLHKMTVKDMMIGLRETAEDCPVELLVYHPAFIYYDQYTVITVTTIQTVLIAAAVMLVVSLVLIPSPLCSVWVAFAICSVMVGVTGFMSLWGVSLDSISMINLVMCIGFSVDFSAHISYAFVSSNKSDVNEKATEALARLGSPILQGALSTILGVVVLSMSGSYIFRTFFRIVFLVIAFGVLHGLVFIPVFLTVLGACWKSH